MSTSQTWITVIHLPFSSTVWPPRHSGSALSAFIAARNSCKSKGCKKLCTRLKDTEREFWRNQRNANMFFPLPSATFYSPRVWRRQLLGQDVGRILLIWVLHSFFWKQIEKGKQHLICKGSHAWQIKDYMIPWWLNTSNLRPLARIRRCFAVLRLLDINSLAFAVLETFRKEWLPFLKEPMFIKSMRRIQCFSPVKNTQLINGKIAPTYQWVSKNHRPHCWQTYSNIVQHQIFCLCQNIIQYWLVKKNSPILRYISRSYQSHQVSWWLKMPLPPPENG